MYYFKWRCLCIIRDPRCADEMKDDGGRWREEGGERIEREAERESERRKRMREKEREEWRG